MDTLNKIYNINEGFEEDTNNNMNENIKLFLKIVLLIVISYVMYKVNKRYTKIVFNSNISMEKGKDSYFFSNIFLKIIFILLLITNFIVFIAYNYSYISEVNLNNMEDNMYLSSENQKKIEKLKENKKIANIIENINYYSAISLIIFIIISVVITNRKEILNSLHNYSISLKVARNLK